MVARPERHDLRWLVSHLTDAEETSMVRRFAGLATDRVEETSADSP